MKFPLKLGYIDLHSFETVCFVKLPIFWLVLCPPKRDGLMKKAILNDYRPFYTDFRGAFRDTVLLSSS